MKRPLLVIGSVFAAACAAAVGIYALGHDTARPIEVNDPAAQRLYSHSLMLAAKQPHLTVYTETTWTAQGDLGGIDRVVVTTRIRSAGWRGVSVQNRRTGGLPGSPFSIILASRTLCVKLEPGGWGCAPAHPVSAAWYIRQYLLGGRVAHVRYWIASRPRRSPSLTIHFAGRGVLGCTPAGAGEGTSQGYRWCRFRDLDQQLQNLPVTGELVIDRASWLPRELTARGAGSLSPVIETAAFQYGGGFTVARPAHGCHIPCMSLVPALHCVELRAHPHATTDRVASLPVIATGPSAGRLGG